MQHTLTYARMQHTLTYAYAARSNQVNEDIKYVQLLWVTKDLQQVIKGGADDRRAAEIQVSCFTSTKVQILTCDRRAAEIQVGLALPVQKYKY